MKKTKVVIALSFVLIFALLIEPAEVLRSLMNADFQYVLAALAFVFVIRCAMALRWQLLLAIKGIFIGYGESVHVNLVSHSVGFISPGGVGADLMRGHHAYSQKQDLTGIASAIVMDRILGVASMLFVAIASISWLMYEGFSGIAWLPELLALCCAALMGLPIGLICLRMGASKLGATMSHRPRLNKLLIKIGELTDFSTVNRQEFTKLFLVSFIMQLLRCMLFVLLFLALGIELGWVLVFAFTPLVFIVMLLPVSIGGIGLREGAIFLLFGASSVSLEQSISVGILFYAAQVVMVVPGLVLFLVSSIRRQPQED